MLAIVASTYIPLVSAISPLLIGVAKVGLTLTLFLIGAGLTREVLFAVGFKPLLQGVVLWIVISAAALFAIIHFA